MAKVSIQMDEGWRWWPEQREKTEAFFREPTVDIDDGWLANYRLVSSQFYEMQAQLEQLYRKQEGLAVFDDPELVIPHKML